jgi:hypothetical protein
MKIATRHIEDVLVVDMIGDFPEHNHEMDIWRDSLYRALEGHSGRVILHIPDAGMPQSKHLQAMISAFTSARVVYDSLSYVTPNDQLRDLFSMGHLGWAYETLDEALRPPKSGGHGCLVGCILVIVGISIGVYFLIRVLFG